MEKQLQHLVEENEKLEEEMNNSPGLRDFQKFKTKTMEEVKFILNDLKTKLQKK